MTSLRKTIALLFVAVAGMSQAQDPGKPEQRGSMPPGTSQDGSRPSDGAIQGGSIAPGKTDGVPDALLPRTREQQVDRCKELKGALAEQCLRDLDASAGSSAGAPRTGASTPGAR